MRRHGLGGNIDIIASDWSEEGGHRAAEELLARKELPTAIHAGADVAAFGLLGALWETQYHVPENISVVGYDNTPEAAHAPVALTSVDQSGIEMGADAANLLLERIDGRTGAVHHLVTPTLVVRRTSTKPRA